MPSKRNRVLEDGIAEVGTQGASGGDVDAAGEVAVALLGSAGEGSEDADMGGTVACGNFADRRSVQAREKFGNRHSISISFAFRDRPGGWSYCILESDDDC